jgi:hypothetical protein
LPALPNRARRAASFRISIFQLRISIFFMPLCIALVPSRTSASSWDRCPHRALRGDRFCAEHRTAVDGALMGFLDSEQNRHAKIKRRRKALGKFLPARKKDPRAKANGEVNTTRTPVREIRVDESPLSAFFEQEIERPSPRAHARTSAD